MNRLKMYNNNMCNFMVKYSLIVGMQKSTESRKDLTLGPCGLFSFSFSEQGTYCVSPVPVNLACSKYVFERINA